MLPALVLERCGGRRSQQLGAFITAMIDAAAQTGRIGMTAAEAEALGEFRRFNYEQVYLRPASRQQATAVIDLLRALVEHYAANPRLLPDAPAVDPDSERAVHAAVTYVGGMTDRFACRVAVRELDWDPARLPRSVDDI